MTANTSLLVAFLVCVTVVYSLYYIVVGLRLKKIKNLLKRETNSDTVSLKDLEKKLYKLLEERKEEL